MSIVEWKKDESAAIITMNTSENRHNLNYMIAMLTAFDEIIKDETISSVVIASSDKKNWCLGIDVDWMMEMRSKNDEKSLKEFSKKMNEFFKTILLYPMPVIAAINGHAFGNGSVLACACDFRFMKSDRGFFCFPEVDLSIPFMPAMIAFIQRAIPYYKFQELAFTGKRVGAKELEDHHVLVKACENEETLMRDAIAYAKTFNKKRDIFGELKKRMHKHIIEIIDQG